MLYFFIKMGRKEKEKGEGKMELKEETRIYYGGDMAQPQPRGGGMKMKNTNENYENYRQKWAREDWWTSQQESVAQLSDLFWSWINGAIEVVL